MIVFSLLPLALLVLGSLQHAYAKAVFAHFMVSNAENYTRQQWEDDIRLAKEAHIDAFALNMAFDGRMDTIAIAHAYAAAEIVGDFKLFFSFDYAGNGPWSKPLVMSTILNYKDRGSQYRHNGQPLVSTFEGPEWAEDWYDIKEVTGCFFVPDWSSLGAKGAMEAGGGVADGLFSWAAWPWGPQNMDTYVDASYLQYLDGKPYMMPVSPWFYTNLPQWKKNWVWRGDNLWYDRWQEVLTVQPEWVQIISWNDYGESHYIGPIVDDALGALRSAPFNFVEDMPHDAWRTFLPTAIDLYVKNTTIISEEGVVVWYRPNLGSACSDGSTTGNTASQLQLEFSPVQVMADAVFYTAQLASAADITVSIGGVSVIGTWSDVPARSAGLYHGNVTFDGHTGDVAVTLLRHGNQIAFASGTPIASSCTSVNWNAWVGQGLSDSPVRKALSMKDSVCIRGTGVNDFAPLCEFACKYGYCPVGACTCLAMGPQQKKPERTGVVAYPVAGRSADYSGLCSFNCNYGKVGDPWCPSDVCGTVKVPLVIPDVSPFAPPACRSGVGSPGWEGLCSYACNFGYCPSHICTCTETGPLNAAPPVVRDTDGFALQPGVNDYGICDFSCKRGYCPTGSCNQKPKSGGGDLAFINGDIWKNPDPVPVIGCSPPCVIVLPPYEIPTTTITCAPTTMTMIQSWEARSPMTEVTTISFAPIVTDRIPVFNINITQAAVDSVTYYVTPSLFCVAAVTVSPPVGVTTPPYGSSELTYYVTSTPPATDTWPPSITGKTKVSFTSTDRAMPTCTTGCGEECRGENCNDCNNRCSCAGCCKRCNNDDGDDDDDDDGSGPGPGPGIIWPLPKIPIPCFGWTCPPGSSLPKGGGGGNGDPNDPDCSTRSQATHTTVYCKFTSSSPLWTRTSTCTSTRHSTISGCNLRPTTTTRYTSSNCQTFPAYTPVWGDYTAPLPGPGNPLWGGYVVTHGTYQTFSTPRTTTSATPKPTPDGPIPSGTEGMAASYGIWYWKQGNSQHLYGYDNSVPVRPAKCDLAGGEGWWYQWETSVTNNQIPDSLTGVKVYGDSSCKFTKSDMKLRCEHWATATCVDWKAPEGPAGECCGNDCSDYYKALLGCKWDD